MLYLLLLGFLNPKNPMNYAWYYDLKIQYTQTELIIRPQAKPWMPSVLARGSHELASAEIDGNPHLFDIFNFPAIASGGLNGKIDLTLIYQVRDTAGVLVDEKLFRRRVKIQGREISIRTGGKLIGQTDARELGSLQGVSTFLGLLAAPDGYVTMKRSINRDFVVELIWGLGRRTGIRQNIRGRTAARIPFSHRHPLATAFCRDGVASPSAYPARYRETMLAKLDAYQNYEDPERHIEMVERFLAMNPGDSKGLQTLLELHWKQGREETAHRIVRRLGPLLPEKTREQAEALYRQKRDRLMPMRHRFKKNPKASISLSAPQANAPVAGMVDLTFTIADAQAPVLLVDCTLNGKTVATFDRAPFRTRFSTRGFSGKQSLVIRASFFDQTYAQTSIPVEVIPIDDFAEVHVTPLRAVVTQANQFITDLQPEQFAGRLAGEPITLSRLERETAPLRISLLMDISSSMQGEKILSAQHAAYRFLENLSAPDEAELIAFDHKALRIVPFSSNPEDFYPGLFGLDPRGGTALYDAIVSAADVLAERDGVRVIIVVSDGRDRASRAKVGDVKQRLIEHGIMLYAVTLDELVTELALLARATGSVYTNLDETMDVTGTLKRIYRELKSFYYAEITTPAEPNLSRLKLKLKGRKGTPRIRRLLERQ
ncbi:MAG: VWA domain-containing protein [Acidobacteriota bacterium]|nr:VWA domain-containing protein [Acidobacteriota bacterium]